jgi:hypothetical protein
VRVHDTAASRQHARLAVAFGEVIVEDLGSHTARASTARRSRGARSPRAT